MEMYNARTAIAFVVILFSICLPLSFGAPDITIDAVRPGPGKIRTSCAFTDSSCIVVRAEASLTLHMGVDIDWAVHDSCKKDSKGFVAGMFHAYIVEATAERSADVDQYGEIRWSTSTANSGGRQVQQNPEVDEHSETRKLTSTEISGGRRVQQNLEVDEHSEIRRSRSTANFGGRRVQQIPEVDEYSKICSSDLADPSVTYACRKLEPSTHYRAVIVGPKCSNAYVEFKTPERPGKHLEPLHVEANDNAARGGHHVAFGGRHAEPKLFNLTAFNMGDLDASGLPAHLHHIFRPHFSSTYQAGVGCLRPDGWCTQAGATFKNVDCDGDGLLDIWCEDTSNNRLLDLTSLGCSSVSTPTYADCPAALSDCNFPDSGWCGNPGQVRRRVDCDGDGRLDLYCISPGNTPNAIARAKEGCQTYGSSSWNDCPTARAACTRPAGWCESPGQTYRRVDCDGDGVLDHWCEDATGSFGSITSSSGCTSVWPGASYASCPAAKINTQVRPCDRPAGWCTQPTAIYKNVDCDYDGLLDHWCEDPTGNKGHIKSLEGCAARWPSQTYADCPPAQSVGSCAVSSVSLKCNSNVLTFACTSGAGANIEIRRAVMTNGQYVYPESRRVMIPSAMSPYTIPYTLQPRDKIIIKGVTNTGASYSVSALCPPDFLPPTPSPTPSDKPTPDLGMNIPDVQFVCGSVVEGGSLTMTCPPFTTSYGPTFVNFGVTTGSCSTGFKASPTCNTNALSNAAQIEIRNNLWGLATGSVRATTAIFGDPCPGTRKTLTMTLACYFQPYNIVTGGTTTNSSAIYPSTVLTNDAYMAFNGVPPYSGMDGIYAHGEMAVLKATVAPAVPWMKATIRFTNRAIAVRMWPRTDACCLSSSTNLDITLRRRGVGDVWTTYVATGATTGVRPYVVNIQPGIDFDEIYIAKRDQAVMAIAEMEVVAVGAPMPVGIGGLLTASGVSPSGGSLGPLSKLTDGTVDKNATATNNQFRPWWNINLQSVYYLLTIVFHPRYDCCFDQSSYIDLTIFLNGVPQWTTYIGQVTGSNPIIIQIPGGILGDSLKIQKRDTNYMAAVEVMIYALV